MNTSHRSPRSLKRGVSLAAIGALTLALLPAGTAAGQTAAEPRGSDNVCPGPIEPYTDFTDVPADNVHQGNIECLVGYGIAQGFTPTSYRPRGQVTRIQMATFITNFVETATGEELPREDTAFTDIGDINPGSRENIEKLATAGIVQGLTETSYAPGRVVQRGAMATFIANAIDFAVNGTVDGTTPPAASTSFTDVEGTTHQLNIPRLENQQIVTGTGGGFYRPGNPVFRDAMSTFIMQGADYLDELGAWLPTADDPDQPLNVIPVTPADDQTVEAGDEVDFTADVSAVELGTDDDEEYRITLVDADNVTIGDGGFVTFETTEASDAPGVTVADAGPPESALVSVNDEAPDFTGDATHTVGGVEADDGEITFTAVAAPDEAFIAVVYPDGGASTFLEVDQTGAPTEQFGHSGTITTGEAETLDTVLSWINEVDDEQTPVVFGQGQFDAEGSATVTITEDDTVEFEVEYGEVDGPFADGPGFHIHEGAIDENGPIVITLAEGAELDEGAGSLTGTVEADDTDLSDDAFADLLEDIVENPEDYYLNLHSDAFPEGAIRGQLPDGGQDEVLDLVADNGFVVNVTDDEPAEGATFGTIQAAFDAAEEDDELAAFGGFDETATLGTDGVGLFGVDAVLTGSLVLDADDAFIAGLTILHGTATGILTSGEGVFIVENVIEGAGPASGRGIETTASSDDLFIDGNVIRESATGIFVNGGETLILDNTLSDHQSAIATDTNDDVDIFDNTITDNDEGIGVGGSNVTIEDNTFASNTAHVRVYVSLQNAYLTAVLAGNEFDSAVIDRTPAQDVIRPEAP